MQLTGMNYRHVETEVCHQQRITARLRVAPQRATLIVFGDLVRQLALDD
jgi:hypothetical protein